MPKYINKNTGLILDSPDVLSGENIAIFSEIDEVTEKIPEESAEKNSVEEGITIKEIKRELEAFGIEYNPNAKKQELYDLMCRAERCVD